ncbi:MAG TPA: phosphatase PAP2-related protein [Anaeromyxobacteraceae bacterium]|nr:phosphatase PAP2-related protein [Anaeromyxobacteraceae bacterium]
MAHLPPPPPAARDERGAGSRLRALLSMWPALLGAAAFRYGCYAAMTALALWNEARPAPSLPDLVLERLPYLPWVDRANYLLWLALYLPLAAALLWLEPRRWVRYMVTGGLVSLARGVTIALTGLGAPRPSPGGGLGGRGFWGALAELVSPLGVFQRDAIAVYLQKDLFFSGHAATTFLLWLYLRHRSLLAPAALLAHLAVVASVMLSHIHYAIDVVGAWAIAFALYALREGWPSASPPTAEPPGTGGEASSWPSPRARRGPPGIERDQL